MKFLNTLMLLTALCVTQADAQVTIFGHGSTVDCANERIHFDITYGNFWMMESYLVTLDVSCNENGPWEYSGGSGGIGGGPVFIGTSQSSSNQTFLTGDVLETFKECCSGYYRYQVWIDGQLWATEIGHWSFCECL